MSEETELGFKIRLLQSMPKLFDSTGKEMSIHFRMNHATKEFEVIVNRACKKCTSFKKIGGGNEICVKCKYIKDWLGLGKRWIQEDQNH